MTVSELIATLQQMPADARVMISGIDVGFADVGEIKSQRVALNFYDNVGPHEEVYESYGDPQSDASNTIVMAVTIDRDLRARS